ncbi:glycosyltransferase family 2 protein [Undibacterium sp. Ren11W]|uniref:glycosyltransferase family 2 protein n=1 Tax=Undibacterium sp. Ren11W TaxID=3413045 RepID=UPI003BF09C40
MKKIVLSVIIPAYNAAAYIKDSLGALLGQIDDRVELLVVDDGSTDFTSSIVKECFSSYLERGTLRLFSQENQGVSAARNLGISHAAGQFVGFFDADDVALPGYFEKIFGALKSGADIIEFAYKTFVSSTDELALNPIFYTNKQFGLHQMPAIIDGVHAIARWYPCTRVFKASLLTGIQFPLGVRFCEDMMTIPLLYEKAQTVFNLSDALYGYRTNPSSATFNVKPDYISNLEKFYKTIPRNGMRRHDFLRIAVAYSVYSCQFKLAGRMLLPKNMSSDMRKLRYSFAVYFEIEPKKIAMLLYPTTFSLMKRIKTVFGKRNDE